MITVQSRHTNIEHHLIDRATSIVTECAAALVAAALLLFVTLFGSMLRYRQARAERQLHLRQVFGPPGGWTQLPY